MALQLTFTADTGIVITNAYFKIDEYSCAKDNTINARLRAYASHQAATEGKAYIEGSDNIVTFTADYNDDAANAKKQIYEFAKTLDKYTDAIDV